MRKLNKEKNIKQSDREFDRSVCMSFFKDHRQLVKRIEKSLGTDMAYKVQSAIIDYGLYRELPEDDELLLYIPEPVLNQIDSNQKRRAAGFKGENLEDSRAIISMHLEHPEMSQNAIAEKLNISKGKVNGTLQKYRNGEYKGIIDVDIPLPEGIIYEDELPFVN